MRPIAEKIGKAAMLEQFAEECMELGHACLKMARIIRGTNPTPVPAQTAWENIIEEYTDVRLCARELEIQPDGGIAKRKMNRWRKRMGT